MALAQCHEILGQLEKAELHLIKAIKHHSDSGMPLKMHAAFFIRTGRVAQAEPILRSSP